MRSRRVRGEPARVGVLLQWREDLASVVPRDAQPGDYHKLYWATCKKESPSAKLIEKDVARTGSAYVVHYFARCTLKSSEWLRSNWAPQRAFAAGQDPQGAPDILVPQPRARVRTPDSLQCL